MEFQEPQKASFLVELARWLSPLLTATALLLFIRSAAAGISNFFRGIRYKDLTAVFCRESDEELYQDCIKHSVINPKTIKKYIDDVIFAMDDDYENLRLLDQHTDTLTAKNVYVKLENIDSFLLRNSSVHYFNLTEMIARQYWKKRNLLNLFNNPDVTTVKIGFLGFEAMGQSLFKYALLNNIYSLDQIIEYHIWGASDVFQKMNRTLELLNNDRIIYHQNPWYNDADIIRDCNRILVTEGTTYIQNLLYLGGRAEIDYYDPDHIELNKIFACDRLSSFGNKKDILNEENIKTLRLYQLAMELNYNYAKLQGGTSNTMQQCWDELDGFTKGSNISAADYHEIRLLLLEKENENVTFELLQKNADRLSRLEHIRWSRYHYINHWVYGQPKDRIERNEKKIHNCLVPYDDLSEEEKQKDFDTIEKLFQLQNKYNE